MRIPARSCDLNLKAQEELQQVKKQKKKKQSCSRVPLSWYCVKSAKCGTEPISPHSNLKSRSEKEGQSVCELDVCDSYLHCDLRKLT